MNGLKYAILIVLLTLFLPVKGNGTYYAVPSIVISPDAGFPIWLTPDPDNYLPLETSQTSGLDWVATDTTPGEATRHWLMMADDSDEGRIHLVSVTDNPDSPELRFHTTSLTLPPPGVSQIPLDPGNGYDWESLSLHPWSGSIFLSQEGSLNEIGIYHGQITPGDEIPSDGAYGRSGPVTTLPGHIANLKRIELPGWDEVFGDHLENNMGIEGIACSEDRLYLGLESPYSFADRIMGEMSTVLAIWKINPDDPSDMDSCELLAVHDTADWADQLGFTIETICGLSVNQSSIYGIDRDNQRLFNVDFSDEGEFEGGRIYILDVPGPAPLAIDECDFCDGLPALIKPSLESVTIVPVVDRTTAELPSSVDVYLAIDPWGPGWALRHIDWTCESYEMRLASLLPALYRYSLSLNDM